MQICVISQKLWILQLLWLNTECLTASKSILRWCCYKCGPSHWNLNALYHKQVYPRMFRELHRATTPEACWREDRWQFYSISYQPPWAQCLPDRWACECGRQFSLWPSPTHPAGSWHHSNTVCTEVLPPSPGGDREKTWGILNYHKYV